MQISFPLALQLLSAGLFAAFGIYTILYLIANLFYNNQFTKRIDYEASRFISVVGACYYFVWLILLFNQLNSIATQNNAFLLQQMFGHYWIGFWTQPLVYLCITQLLRNTKVRELKIARLIMSLLLIVSVDRILSISTVFDINNYIQSWKFQNAMITTTDWMLNSGVKLLVFMTLLSLYHFAKNKFKTIIFIK